MINNIWQWVVFLLLATLLILLVLEIRNQRLIRTTFYTISDTKIDQNLTIIQLSDFHTQEFGRDQKQLFQKIKCEKPDIIMLTGDVLNSREVNLQVAYDLIRRLVAIAPTYYVTGNHEARLPSIEIIHDQYRTLGCQILRDESISLTPQINVSGIDDPSFLVRSHNISPENAVNNSLRKLQLSKDPFNILLSHRPEHFNIYQQFPINLALTGHAHGGQIILPFVGPIFAPNQGFFPPYARGKFLENNTLMIVSRGLGNSSFPIRIHNRPELVIIRLRPSVQ